MSLLAIEADGSGPNLNQTEEYEAWDRRSSHILEVVAGNESGKLRRMYAGVDKLRPLKGCGVQQPGNSSG